MPICANPKCGKDFIANTIRQKYCDIYCSDQARHIAARERARQHRQKHRLETITEAVHQAPEPLTPAERAEADALRDKHFQRVDDDFASLLADQFGYQPKQHDTVPVSDNEQSQSNEAHRSIDFIGKEQAEALKRKFEEERLIALDKKARAERKRQRAIARGLELDKPHVTASSKSLEEITQAIPNRWTEKDKQ